MHVTKAGGGSRALVTNWECETEKASSWQRRFKVGGGLKMERSVIRDTSDERKNVKKTLTMKGKEGN